MLRRLFLLHRSGRNDGTLLAEPRAAARGVGAEGRAGPGTCGARPLRAGPGGSAPSAVTSYITRSSAPPPRVTRGRRPARRPLRIPARRNDPGCSAVPSGAPRRPALGESYSAAAARALRHVPQLLMTRDPAAPRSPARRALTFPCAAPRVRAERGAVRAAARAAPAEGGRGRGGRSWRLGDGSARLAGAVGWRGRLRGGAGSGRGAEEFPGVVYASPPRSVHAHRSLIGHKLGRGPAGRGRTGGARSHSGSPRRTASRYGYGHGYGSRHHRRPRPQRRPARLCARAALFFFGGEERDGGACAPVAVPVCEGGGRRSVGVIRYRCVRARRCVCAERRSGGDGFSPSQAVGAGRPCRPGRCLRPGCGVWRVRVPRAGGTLR